MINICEIRKLTYLEKSVHQLENQDNELQDCIIFLRVKDQSAS